MSVQKRISILVLEKNAVAKMVVKLLLNFDIKLNLKMWSNFSNFRTHIKNKILETRFIRFTFFFFFFFDGLNWIYIKRISLVGLGV